MILTQTGTPSSNQRNLVQIAKSFQTAKSCQTAKSYQTAKSFQTDKSCPIALFFRLKIFLRSKNAFKKHTSFNYTEKLVVAKCTHDVYFLLLLFQLVSTVFLFGSQEGPFPASGPALSSNVPSNTVAHLLSGLTQLLPNLNLQHLLQLAAGATLAPEQSQPTKDSPADVLSQGGKRSQEELPVTPIAATGPNKRDLDTPIFQAVAEASQLSSGSASASSSDQTITPPPKRARTTPSRSPARSAPSAHMIVDSQDSTQPANIIQQVTQPSVIPPSISVPELPAVLAPALAAIPAIAPAAISAPPLTAIPAPAPAAISAPALTAIPAPAPAAISKPADTVAQTTLPAASASSVSAESAELAILLSALQGLLTKLSGNTAAAPTAVTNSEAASSAQAALALSRPKAVMCIMCHLFGEARSIL